MAPAKLGPVASIGIFLLAVTGQSSPGAIIGGFNSNRVGISSIQDGVIAEDLRELITTEIPGTSFASSSSLTADFLSTVDCVIIGAPTIDGVISLTPDEQTNLLDFVKSGGGALIFIDNNEHGGIPAADNANRTFLSPFNITGTGFINAPELADVVLPTHAVMDGPFGKVEYISTAYAGKFESFAAPAQLLATYSNDMSAAVLAIAPHALTPKSGGVVFIADANLLVDTSDGGYIENADNKTFLLNTVSYIVPEPTVLSTGLVGLAVLTLRRRRNWRIRG